MKEQEANERRRQNEIRLIGKEDRIESKKEKKEKDKRYKLKTSNLQK